MGDQNQQRMRMGVRHKGGEIVEVEGGHIVRSIGRKDRHSKVCTAKGPRDRRVRLAAHTAIQFYDVQDRLGYDRPSKAVDWLIKKAKSAIDELAELPAWNPTSNWSSSNPNFEQNINNPPPPQPQMAMVSEIGCSSQQMEIIGNDGYLPTSLDSEAIADTIKSFFPMGGNINNEDKFHNFDSSSSEMVLRNQSQDLRLSLQSFQDPILLHQQQQQEQQPQNEAEQGLFSGTTGLGFDSLSSSWSDQNQTGEINRFQRMIAWNGDSGGGGGFVFNSQPQPGTTPFLQPLFGETNQFGGNQRGPLQSSNNNNNTQLNRAWIDPTSVSDHHAVPFYYQSSLQGIGFSGYHIPAWIQGEEEEHDGVSDKPSSASSDSRH